MKRYFFVVIVVLSLLIVGCMIDFQENGETNVAPTKPNYPEPIDNAQDAWTDLYFWWFSEDPDGDPLTFDFYFGTDENELEKIEENLTKNTYTIQGLEVNKTHYWQVVAKDGKGKETASVIWSFTTTSDEQLFYIINALFFPWNISPDSTFIGSGKIDGQGIPPDFFSNTDVRLGFAYSFDYQKLIDSLALPGDISQVPTCLPSEFLGFDDTLTPYASDTEKAKEHFQNAFNGELWDNGFTFYAAYNFPNETRREVLEAFKSSLAEVNPKFHLEIEGLPWPDYLEAMENHRLPLYVSGWIADYFDPHNFIFNFYHSLGDYSHAYGENYDDFADTPRDEFEGKSLNEIIFEASIEEDQQKREQMYKDIQKFVYDNIPVLPLYEYEYYPSDSQ